MARTIQAQTLSPAAFGIGSPVVAEDYLGVIRQLNWNVANRTITHYASNTGAAGDADLPTGTAYITVDATASVFRTRVRVLAHLSTDSDTLGVQFQLTVDAAGTTIRSRVTAGSATAITTSHTSAGNGTPTLLTFAMSSVTPGLRVVTIELERQSGAANASLDWFVVRELARTSVPSVQE